MKKGNINKIRKIIESVQKDPKAMRDVHILSNNYDSKEARIFRKGWNEGYKFRKKEMKK